MCQYREPEEETNRQQGHELQHPKGTVPQVTFALFHHCSFSLAMPSIWSLQWSFPELIQAGPRLGLCPQELALNYSILGFVLFTQRACLK